MRTKPDELAGTVEEKPSVEAAIEDAIQRIGKAILELADQAGPPSFFSSRGIYGKLMEWSLRDPAFKTQLFRFVDVFPALQSRNEIERHFREYIAPFLERAPVALRVGLKTSAASSFVLEAGTQTNITGMARLFMIENTEDALVKTLRRLHSRGLAFTVDLLGETVISEPEADRYARQCVRTLDLLAEHQPWISSDGRGNGPPVNLSVKISALYSQIHPADPETALFYLKERLRPLLRKARERGAFINFDMEHYALKDLTLALFRSLLSEEEFRGYPYLGIALQAYLRDSENDLERLIAWARARSQPITVRLVKGAYWDYETVVARQKNWPVPVFLQKRETDACFERLSLLLLENIDLVTPAFGSHNVRSIAHAVTHAAAFGIAKGRFEIQVLHGMAQPLEEALLRLGYRVRQYCPTGDLIPGMAYLVRRLLENSSNEGFLVARFAHGENAEKLLRDPAKSEEPAKGLLRKEPPGRARFQNLPHLDFTKAEARSRFHQALETVRKQLGQTWPLIIGGKAVRTREAFPSLNPADPSVLIGRAARAGTAEAGQAIRAARQAFPAWARVPPNERAEFIHRTADLMEERRFELAALEVFEAGKNWIEADADVAEAIDFCRFYASEMRRLGRAILTQDIPGEENLQHWLPRGAGVVIAPWNFPLAILCGMTAAALVTGNTVIMKPAEQTPILGAQLMQIFAEAGIPDGVLNLMTGFGDSGAFLASHPGIDFIAFTGSKEVGLEIWKNAGETRPGQRNLKKAVCEMGGKNALIVDADADLDEAIPAILYSAFGYQGQKCSALSRLIVLDEIYQPLLARLVPATANLRMGDPVQPGVMLGPVIDESARDKCNRYIEIGKQEARLVFQGKTPPDPGFFVAPAIFADVPPNARIAREEIFGPVLSVLRARTFDEAIALANDSEFALTGGICSRSPARIERAKAEVMVGNFYINRTITGAIVERQPFGGFHMSGSGTKAGGRDYLTHFMVPRVISENRLRHGFAPPEDLVS